MPAEINTETQKMDVAIRLIEPKGNLHGFASVTIGGVRIDDFKIVENKDGELFVGFPSKPDKTSATGYRNTVSVDKDLRETFTNKIISAYHAAEQAQTREPAQKKTPVKQQLETAAKAAERHNAEQPVAEKAAKKRETARE